MIEVAEHVDTQPRLYRFSLTDYYRLIKLGFFVGRSAEMINGRIFAMPAQGDRHERCLGMAERRLIKAFGDEFWVRPQMSLSLQPTSVPEPDLAVVRGGPESGSGKPESAVLVIEVSETTLRFDRQRKSHLYARNGIADYWIINLVEHQVEVYRKPIPDASARFGYRYSSIVPVSYSGAVTPLALPGVEIQIAEILPLKR